MRYLLAVIPFAAVLTLSAQSPPPPPIPVSPPVLFGPGTTPPAWDAAHLEFDVASVKANKSGTMMMMLRTLPSNFTATNVPLRMLIMLAYRVSQYQLVGAPGWLDSERFDIVAKPPEGARPDQTMLMVRGLLAERFKLKVHGETRDTQIYELTLARSDGKLGPKMSVTTDDCEKILAERREAARAAGPGRMTMLPLPGANEKPVCTINMRPTPVQNGPPLMTFRGGGQTLQTLMGQLTGVLNRQIVDRTGLTGLFDFELTYSMPMPQQLVTQAATSTGTAPVAPIDDGPTVFDAVRELGLKLESARGPVEHLVIDSVDRPTQD